MRVGRLSSISARGMRNSAAKDMAWDSTTFDPGSTPACITRWPSSWPASKRLLALSSFSGDRRTIGRPEAVAEEEKGIHPSVEALGGQADDQDPVCLQQAHRVGDR